LIDALKKLNKINQNWKLIVWGNKEYYDAGEINDKVVLNGEYNLGMLSEIFDSADVAVIPSKRIETFGFVLAEAVSYAMPCIVSSKLGAIDILKNGHNAIICDLYEDDLVDNLLKIIYDRTVLKKINENILNDEFEDFTQHCGKIFNLYTLILGEN